MGCCENQHFSHKATGSLVREAKFTQTKEAPTRWNLGVQGPQLHWNLSRYLYLNL